jgi:hypothetical protein
MQASRYALIGAGHEDIRAVGGDAGWRQEADPLERPSAMSWSKEPVMKFAANWTPLPLSGRILRFAARHLVGVLLLLALPIVVAVVTRLLASTTMPGAGVIRTGEIVLLMLSPTLLFGAAVCGPRMVRATARFFTDRRTRRSPQPTSRPIEQLAADLRRMLWQHDAVSQSTDELSRRAMPGDADTPIFVAMRARRLYTLEGAIADCATQVARALDVPGPHVPAYGGLDQPRLRRLLRDLVSAGLVLPPGTGLLAPDGRR